QGCTETEHRGILLSQPRISENLKRPTSSTRAPPALNCFAIEDKSRRVRTHHACDHAGRHTLAHPADQLYHLCNIHHPVRQGESFLVSVSASSSCFATVEIE
ncbi:hypothetical protein CLAIMM_09454 isoform 1, partial [Cladophialophora immunda]